MAVDIWEPGSGTKMVACKKTPHLGLHLSLATLQSCNAKADSVPQESREVLFSSTDWSSAIPLWFPNGRWSDNVAGSGGWISSMTSSIWHRHIQAQICPFNRKTPHQQQEMTSSLCLELLWINLSLSRGNDNWTEHRQCASGYHP